MDVLPAIHFDGLVIAIVTFIIIGVFHPIVIKAEYYWGTKCWPLFAFFGTFTLAIAMFMENTIISTLLSVLSCTFFWSIIELYHQKKRVLKGWFPMNPKRKDEYKK
ncbi:MAG: DUF4491 family protein [Proteobacteria bacterium]|nr:DUF4491 family protein [Pseudomonadota bacterium]